MVVHEGKCAAKIAKKIHTTTQIAQKSIAASQNRLTTAHEVGFRAASGTRLSFQLFIPQQVVCLPPSLSTLLIFCLDTSEL